MNGYTKINFLARLSHSYRDGFLDLVNNKLTNVLIISFRARSVNTFSSIHSSTSGRQCSGIIISVLLEADEFGVEIEEGAGEDEDIVGEKIRLEVEVSKQKQLDLFCD